MVYFFFFLLSSCKQVPGLFWFILYHLKCIKDVALLLRHESSTILFKILLKMTWQITARVNLCWRRASLKNRTLVTQKKSKGRVGEKMSPRPLWIYHPPKAVLPGWDWQANYPHSRLADLGERENSTAPLTHPVGLHCLLLSILERAGMQREVGKFTASLRADPLQPSHVPLL